MSFTYSGDPASSPLDALRFSIGDTDQSLPILSDEELSYLLVLNNDDIATASIAAFYAILAKYGRLKDEVTGGLQAKYAQIYDHYVSMIKERQTFNAAVAINGGSFYAGGISVADKINNETDTDTVQAKFTKDQNTSRYLQGQYDVTQYRYF